MVVAAVAASAGFGEEFASASSRSEAPTRELLAVHGHIRFAAGSSQVAPLRDSSNMCQASGPHNAGMCAGSHLHTTTTRPI